MEQLIKNVAMAAGIDEGTAKTAIGHVLLFLRNEAPQGHISEMIDNLPMAREAVAAAEARSDSGVSAVIGVFDSLMGQRAVDVSVLYENLANLGLKEAQSTAVLNEVMVQTERMIGKDGVALVMSEIPSLAGRITQSRNEEALRRNP